MSKKTKIFLIILPCIFLVVAAIAYLILSMFVKELFCNNYSFLTVYENDYYAKTKFWWIYLAFSPLCILPLLLGLKHKDKVVNSVSIVIIIVMLSISFVNFKDTKQYSTSNEYLTLIENNIKYDFHEDTTILVDKKVSSSKNPNIISEGIIRIPANEENIADLEYNIAWENQIDNNIESSFSEKFKFYVSSLDKYAYAIDDNNTLTFLAYYREHNLLFFTIIEINE